MRDPIARSAVRTVPCDEKPRCNEPMRQHHDLGLRDFLSNRLRRFAVLGRRWLGSIGRHAVAPRCAARGRWIGSTSMLRRHWLVLVDKRSRFLGSCSGNVFNEVEIRLLDGFAQVRRLRWPDNLGLAVLAMATMDGPRKFPSEALSDTGRKGPLDRTGTVCDLGRDRGSSRCLPR